MGLGMIGLAVINFVAQKKALEIDKKIDSENDSPADYSVLLSGIPAEETEESIKEFIGKIQKTERQKKADLENHKIYEGIKFLVPKQAAKLSQETKGFDEYASGYYHIEKVSVVKKMWTFTKELKNLERLKRAQAKINSRISKKISKGEKSKHMMRLKTLKEKGETLKDQIREQSKSLQSIDKQLNTDKTLATGIALVSFVFKKDRDDFIENFKSNLATRYIFKNFSFQYKNNPVNVEEAPEPEDIIWENLGHSIWHALANRLLTYIGSLFVLIISFLIILGFQYLQDFIIEETEDKTGIDTIEESNLVGFIFVHLISLVISLIIIAINAFLRLVMSYFVALERHISHTSFNTSFVDKLVRLRFINTCGILTFTHFLVVSPRFYLWKEGGLITNATFVLIVNTLLLPVNELIDFPYILKRINRYLFLRRGPQTSKLLQYQVNELMTGKDIYITYSFSDVLSLYYIVVFFLPVLPFAGIFLLLGTTALYFFQKILFSRVYKKPQQVGSDIGLQAVFRVGFGNIILFVKPIFLTHFRPQI